MRNEHKKMKSFTQGIQEAEPSFHSSSCRLHIDRVHVNCCGQRFPPYTETHSPLTWLCLGCGKILCGHRGRVLSVFSAGCSDPLVPKICTTSTGHGSKVFSRASSVEVSHIWISWHQWTKSSSYVCCAAAPQHIIYILWYSMCKSINPSVFFLTCCHACKHFQRSFRGVWGPEFALNLCLVTPVRTHLVQGANLDPACSHGFSPSCLSSWSLYSFA